MPSDAKKEYVDAKIESLEKKVDKIVEILERLTRVEEQNQTNKIAIDKNTGDLEVIKSKMWVVHIMGGLFILAASFFAKQSFEIMDMAKQNPQLTAEQIAEIVIKVNKESEKGK